MNRLSLRVDVILEPVERRQNSWHFRFSGDVGLSCESLWRLFEGGRITYTSSDDSQLFGRAEPVNLVREVERALGGKRLKRIEANEYGDLLLSFTEGSSIQALVTSGGFESYQLDVGAKQFIGAGGGDIVEVPA